MGAWDVDGDGEPVAPHAPSARATSMSKARPVENTLASSQLRMGLNLCQMRLGVK